MPSEGVPPVEGASRPDAEGDGGVAMDGAPGSGALASGATGWSPLSVGTAGAEMTGAFGNGADASGALA